MAFKEETVDLPLHEEELRVTKRPTLREEVVVRTVAHSVEKEGAATLRYEEAEVEDTRKAAPAPTLTKEESTGYTTPGYRR
jgi:stress response protein YsnF